MTGGEGVVPARALLPDGNNAGPCEGMRHIPTGFFVVATGEICQLGSGCYLGVSISGIRAWVRAEDLAPLPAAHEQAIKDGRDTSKEEAAARLAEWERTLSLLDPWKIHVSPAEHRQEMDDRGTLPCHPDCPNCRLPEAGAGPCVTCGRDDLHGTHTALQIAGHLDHTYREGLS